MVIFYQNSQYLIWSESKFLTVYLNRIQKMKTTVMSVEPMLLELDDTW